VSVAAAVAWAVHREAAGELAFITKRVDAMLPAAALSPDTIALRTLDEVGKLTLTFDHLVDRLAEATGTGRKSLAEAQLADAERQQFLAAVSHELRTPLNAILGFTELMLAEIDGPISDDVRDDRCIDLWRALGSPTIIALGRKAAARLKMFGISDDDVIVFPHPQYVRRFHHHDRIEYGSAIERCIHIGADKEDKWILR
jgi:signal transduction histidine kinase